MRSRAALLAATLLSLSAACRSTGPSAVPADAAATARALSAVLAAREAAWSPRRFQALYRGEVSPKVGTIVRGYLALRWDGETLFWNASVPLAGGGRGGTLRRSGGEAAELFPGRLEPADVLSALFGVPEEPPRGDGAVVRGGRVELGLASGAGRAVLVSPSGEVTGLLLPDGVRVELTPGSGVPRAITVKGPEGNARLALESYGPWPSGGEGPRE